YLAPGHSYRFQVSAIDLASNVSTPASGPTFTLALRQDNNAAIAYTGGWQVRNHAYASGGTTRATSAANQTATFTFSGTSVAWISTRGADRGQAEVYVDGQLKGTVDLYNATLQGRRIVFAANNLGSGQH